MVADWILQAKDMDQKQSSTKSRELLTWQYNVMKNRAVARTLKE